MSMYKRKPEEPLVEQPGKGWQNTDDCWSSYWNPQAEAWVAYVNTGPRGDVGPAGKAGTIDVSSTITGLPGTEANVVNIGNEVSALLEFTIPRGDPGEDGADGVSPTVNVGTTTTLPAGSDATVTNSGTETDAVFEFSIPKGDKGDKGPTGPQGPIGTGVTYKGAIDATTAPEPANPKR